MSRRHYAYLGINAVIFCKKATPPFHNGKYTVSWSASDKIQIFSRQIFYYIVFYYIYGAWGRYRGTLSRLAE